jgi:hypothetical protein
MAKERNRTPVMIVLSAVQQLSKALHEDRLLVMNILSGHTVTLPASTGSRALFRLWTTIAPTSNSNIIKVANGTDVMAGSVLISLSTGVGVNFPTVAASDTITMNRGTQGGASNGEWLEFLDIIPGTWMVRGGLNGSGALATPFSATVS